MSYIHGAHRREPWNKGKLIGQKLPLKPHEVWSIRVRLDMAHDVRDLALFNLAIDSKLRGCDLVKLMVRDVARGTEIMSRTKVIQQKTKRPVSFEITPKTKDALAEWIKLKNLCSLDYLFPSSYQNKGHLEPRHYARLVKKWVCSIGLDSTAYGTHSMRRTKVALIYRQTKNLRAVQILLGHRSLESTVRYLGIEIDDALELSEHAEI
jgi:integrase